MAPVSRIGTSGQIRLQNESLHPQENFLDLRKNYRFPGSQTMRQWKDTGPDQEATRKYGDILRADRTSQAGFQRIARIGDGTTPNQHDDRVAIGLILDAINSNSLTVKRTGLEYMQALLSQPMSAQKAQFVYDSIVNNVVNSVGWTIEAKQDFHSGREVLSQLDNFSLMILRQYNIYPNLDLPSLLQARQLPHTVVEGTASLNDVRAYLHSRLADLRPTGIQGDTDRFEHQSNEQDEHQPIPETKSRKVEGFADYEGFINFPRLSILLKGLQVDLSILTRPTLIRV